MGGYNENQRMAKDNQRALSAAILQLKHTVLGLGYAALGSTLQLQYKNPTIN